MKVLNIVFAFINLFFGAFVAFKVYGWFYTEVGFELPPLTYLQILAISCILSIFIFKPTSSLQLSELYSLTEDYKKNSLELSVFGLLAFSLLTFWLIKITLY